MSELLKQSQVGAGRLPTLHYLPEFVTRDEEQRLLTEVHASQAKWVQLSGRRLQNHGGIVHTKGLIPAPMPRWLEQLCSRLNQQLPLFGDQGPNHVLINSYQPGCGIMPHQDGPLYHPVVCILSLGSPAVLRFWRKQPEGGTGGLPPVASILAMPRSLLIFQDEAYHDCLHGIQEVTHEVIDSSIVNPEVAQLLDTLQVQNGTALAQQQPAQAAANHAAHPAHNSIDTILTNSSSSNGASHSPADLNNTAAAAAAAGPKGAGAVSTVRREGERTSLTIRRVLKVHKALGSILKR